MYLQIDERHSFKLHVIFILMLNVNFIIVIVISSVISVLEMVRILLNACHAAPFTSSYFAALTDFRENLPLGRETHRSSNNSTNFWLLATPYVTDVNLSQSQHSVSNLPPGDGRPNGVSQNSLYFVVVQVTALTAFSPHYQLRLFVSPGFSELRGV